MRRTSLAMTAAILATSLAVLALAGCGKNAPLQPVATQPSQAKTDLTAARDLLGRSEDAVLPVGRKDGPSGASAVKAMATAETTVKEARARADAAKLALAAAPDVEAQAQLADLEKALALFESAIPLGRALALEDDPCQQAIDGWNKLAQAIPLGNSDEYAKALKLAKEARVLLLKAETQLAASVKAYPGSPSLKTMHEWCADARELADIEIKMDTAGKKGDVSRYNKLVTSFNTQKSVVSGRPDPGAAWNALNGEWRAAYDKAAAAYAALK